MLEFLLDDGQVLASVQKTTLPLAQNTAPHFLVWLERE